MVIKLQLAPQANWMLYAFFSFSFFLLIRHHQKRYHAELSGFRGAVGTLLTENEVDTNDWPSKTISSKIALITLACGFSIRSVAKGISFSSIDSSLTWENCNTYCTMKKNRSNWKTKKMETLHGQMYVQKLVKNYNTPCDRACYWKKVLLLVYL